LKKVIKSIEIRKKSKLNEIELKKLNSNTLFGDINPVIELSLFAVSLNFTQSNIDSIAREYDKQIALLHGEIKEIESQVNEMSRVKQLSIL
jgi:hypothetical protein